ncbi:molybdopterin oxidoreductase family protein [Ferrimonas lipolytica]|uniref:Nitrate reductase n=1 Tax=Ferrimonas lipolytica TaxID=2724191 RepID=A0A6H1UF43_9GAMM|nr:nitrate reductase [Ferrimonas lipolytica]QIZ77701.1 nitrate reductase [Ferrimonas lipolytica]
MSKVLTTCPYCGVGCGVAVTANGDAIQVEGDPNHPANYGRLCGKGMQLAQTLSPAGRLLQPHIDGKPESWSRATAHIASRFRQAIDRYGPDSVAFYLSGQLLTEDYYVANKLMKGFIGSANVDTNSRLCMSSAVAAHKRAFGSDTVPGCYQDFEQADLVVLVGSNLAWCQPVLFQRMMAAKAKRPQMKLVVIDPRRTATAAGADLHLPLQPGTDLALFHGLLRYLSRNAACTQQALAQLSLAQLNDYSIDKTAEITQLPLESLTTFFQWFKETDKTVTGFSMGINQSVNGVGQGNAIINCHLLTGRIGKPGMGPFSITGQPNAMGGREVGGLATSLAGHVDFADSDKRDAVAALWGSDNIATRAGLTAVPMFEAMAAGKIKVVWILGTNPMVSLPDTELVRRALQTCPTVVVSDCVIGTDTQRYADVLLPAKGWGEKQGTVTNSERRISRQRSFVAAQGRAQSDWWALCQVAKAMGFASGFDYRNEAEIFREHATLSAINGGPFDISALAQFSDHQYQQMGPLQWPQPAGKPLQLQPQRLFSSSGAGKIVIDHPQPRLGQGNFIVNSGRNRDQWHTMTRTGLATTLGRHRPYPQISIHPDDAAALGARSNDLLQLGSDILAPITISQSQRRGELFMPIHWSDNNSSAGSVNRLIDSQYDPISQQPGFKGARVEAKAQTVMWWGQLLLPTEIAPSLALMRFWTKQKVDEGTIWWFATDTDPECWRQWLITLPQLGRVWVDQQGNGLSSVLMQQGEQLSAALQLSPQHGQLAGDGWQEVLGQRLSAHLLQRLLVGRDEQLLCACVGLTESQVDKAIEDGANTAEKITQACGAGGGCGVCSMELQQRCDAHQQRQAVVQQGRVATVML